jgi:hypothetical protein
MITRDEMSMSRSHSPEEVREVSEGRESVFNLGSTMKGGT